MIGAGVLAAIALVVGIMFASGVFKNERVVTRTTTVTVP